MLRREQLQTDVFQPEEGLQPADVSPFDDPFLTVGGLREHLLAVRIAVELNRPQTKKDLGNPK